MNFWKTFLACLLALFVSGIVSVFFSFLVLLGFVAMLGSMSTNQEDAYLKNNSILYINLEESISDNPNSDVFNNFDPLSFEFKSSHNLAGIIAKIDAAASDDRISGIYLEFPAYALQSSDVSYQLRSALEKFKESQKFVIAYSDYYTQSSYYLASVADMVYLNPVGGLEWKGMTLDVMMYKNLLDKIGVQTEVFRHGKFKGAVEPFLLENISPENREQLKSIANSIWGNVVEQISENRFISVDSLQSYANNLSVAGAQEARDLKFVDSLIYKGAMMDKLAELSSEFSGKPNLVKISRYNEVYKTISPNKIAVLYAVGEIVDNGDGYDNIVGEKTRKELAKLADDDNVKAVVLRVNSRGGSALASEVILDEVKRLKEKKPLVVSMGDYAASGGYYISCYGDKIIADPSTITGSIGVFGLTFNVSKGANEMLGVNLDVVNTNTSSDLGNIFRPTSVAEREFIQKGVERVYDTFIGHVAQARNMEVAMVDSIAQGRVWSGLQAEELGLVDQIGTMSDAVVVAAQLAAVEDFSIQVYPKNDQGGFKALFNRTVNTAAQILNIAQSPEKSYRNKLEQIAKRQGVLVRMPYDVELK